MRRFFKPTPRKFTSALVVVGLACGANSLFATPAKAVSAGDWRPGRIIDDAIFYNKSSMNIDQIQQFLNAKVPVCDNWGTKPYAGTTRRAYSEARGVHFPLTCLKDYQENTSTHENNLEGRPVPGGAKSAAQIIWEAAQDYNINPQVLLVILQREQALVNDDWPWPAPQFDSAMGYACPDNGPNHSIVCSGYYGFATQVQTGAWQIRRYADHPNNYNFVPGNNQVQWSPQPSCGSNNVVIENQATASLYDYAPYQPNQAALNNMYGTGDSCSSYANRNFWRDFNDWFGASRAGEPMIIKADNSLTQYVLVNGTRYPIPSGDIKLAWGLDRYPLIEMNASYVGSVPVGDSLSRVVRAQGEPMVFFIDNSKKYYVPSWDTLAAWNYSPADLRQLPWSIMNLDPDGPWLNGMAREPNDGPSVYLMDGTTKYHVATSDTVQAWQGSTSVPMTMSQALYDRFTDEGAFDTFKVQSGSGQKYVVNAGYKLPVDATLASAFPGSFATMSDVTLNRLQIGAVPTNFVKAPDSPYMYLLDNTSKRWITSPALLGAWAGGQPTVTYLTQGHLNKMSNGANITSYLASNNGGSACYFMNGGKKPVPSNLRQSYVGAQTPTTLSDQALNSIATSPNATKFLQVSGQPSIYVLDNGTVKNFPSWEDFALWGGSIDQVTQVSAAVLSQFNGTGTAKAYVTDGSNNYLLATPGTYYGVNAAAASNWNLSSPSQINSNTLSQLTNASATLPSSFSIGSKKYLIRGGVGYGTDDTNVQALWGLGGSQTALDSFARKYFSDQALTKYVTSSEKADNKIYAVTESEYLHISGPAQMLNLGYHGEGVVNVGAADIDALGASSWNNIIVKNGSDYYVIDSGAKHKIASNAVSQWTNNQSLSVQTVSSAFINLLTTGPDLGKTFRSPDGPKIYAGVNGQKRWVTGYDIFVQQYAPEINVSTNMTQSLPDGPSL